MLHVALINSVYFKRLLSFVLFLFVLRTQVVILVSDFVCLFSLNVCVDDV